MDGVYVREYIGADYTQFDFMVINGKDVYGVFEGEGVSKSYPKTWTSATKFTFETPYGNEQINAEISKGKIFFRGTGINPVSFKFVRDLTANVPIDIPFLGRYTVIPKTNPPKYVFITGLGAVDFLDVANPKPFVFDTIVVDNTAKTATMKNSTSAIVINMTYSPTALYTDDKGVDHKLGGRYPFDGKDDPDPPTGSGSGSSDTSMALILGLVIAGLLILS
jgi:hypothetical protein